MEAGGVPIKGIERINGRPGDLPTKGAKPLHRYDLYVNGIKYQSRWFDKNGNVLRNRDYVHQDAHKDHYFPHDHKWEWIGNKPIRDKNLTQPDYNKYY